MDVHNNFISELGPYMIEQFGMKKCLKFEIRSVAGVHTVQYSTPMYLLSMALRPHAETQSMTRHFFINFYICL